MADFFDTETPLPTEVEKFEELGLSNPLIRALKKMKFSKPTPVQNKMIPIALQGRDVCASAVTGSGKTAAFLIPIIERLIRNQESEQQTRAIILSPTRELAAQTFTVLSQLFQYTTLTALLLTGGITNPRIEEERLLQYPDILVCTPGRLVDHIKNCEGFTLENVKCFVLDEADNLLNEGFQTQIEEIHKKLPETTQSLLVTATLTTPVTRLIEMTLKNPVRIELDDLYQVSSTLKQEFIRITPENRMASLIAILSRVCTKRTIIFVEKKKRVHDVFLTLKALNMPVAELHGDMSQLRRNESVSMFASCQVEFLVASDVAARGLDIKGIENVVNFNMPHKMNQYVHRVGRTARIGAEGRAVAFIGENDRDLMREIISLSASAVVKRTIPEAALESCQRSLDGIKEKVEEMYQEEKEMGEMEKLERAIARAKQVASDPNSVLLPKRQFVSKEKRKPNDARKIASKIQRRKEKEAKRDKKRDAAKGKK